MKVNVLEVLERELADSRKGKNWISLGAVTDPYQPAEKKYQLARGAFKLLAKYSWPSLFSTKSDLLLRDLDVLKEASERSNGAVAMTLTTLDPKLQKLLEPHAVSVERRLEALRAVKKEGIPCGIHLMPIIPYLTDGDEAIEGMVKAAKEVDVDYFSYNTLRLRGGVVRGYYFQALKRHDPGLYYRTLKLYGSGPHPPENYRLRLKERVEFFRNKWGLRNRWRGNFQAPQMELFAKE